MSALTRRIRRGLWAASQRVGRPVGADVPQRATVLLTFHHPDRAVFMSSLVRSALRCRFVDRVVVSSHNPGLRIEDWLTVKDPRLAQLNSSEARGCGHRWRIADATDGDYFIVIDDDILLRPSQIARLFQHLVHNPTVPHGVSGMRRLADDQLEFHDRQEMAADFLCEVYAVTRQHIRRFGQMAVELQARPPLASMIEAAADFVVISQTGDGRPRIHDLGHILRSETFKQADVAVHKNPNFATDVAGVLKALDALSQAAHSRASAR